MTKIKKYISQITHFYTCEICLVLDIDLNLDLETLAARLLIKKNMCEKQSAIYMAS